MSAFATLVRRTPLVSAPPALGREVFLKLECLQRTGSFKLRGAALRLDALSPEERARGVVTASAGNHGQGVALAGRALGIRVEVLVPETSPEVKRRAMAELGAVVTLGGATYDAAEAAARARAGDSGAVFVSAFDDEQVIRGNGATLAEEILAQAPGTRRVVCTVGGGGMISGLAGVLAPLGVEVAGVQPAANCAMHESLAAGRAFTVYDGEPTLAEGCEGAVAERTFELCRRHRVGIALVPEDAIRRAVAFAYRSCGVVVEPTAAVALAGALASPPPPHTVIVLSGGNIEPELLNEILADQKILADQTM